MARFSRRKPVTVEYPHKLYAVCDRDPKTGKIRILDTGPEPRESAEYFASCVNKWLDYGRGAATLCPVYVHVDTSDLDDVSSSVVLEPIGRKGKDHPMAGKTVHRGKASDCEVIADAFNERENENPARRRVGLKAVVVAKGGA
jgi:hypothetical protein